MEWLKAALPVIETGLKVYISGKALQKSAQNAKEVAVRSSIVAFGVISFLVFFIAAVLMTFVDLGHQLESPDGVHFSGMMMSSLWLTFLGIVIAAICSGIAYIMTLKERKEKALELPEEKHPYAPLAVFAEELLRQLMANLNQKNQHQNPTSPPTSES